MRLIQGSATRTWGLLAVLLIPLMSGRAGASLSITDSQRQFAAFVPVGRSSARLQTDISLVVGDSSGIDAEICAPTDKESIGLELGPSSHGIALIYMAGSPGEFLPEGTYSSCKTADGTRACAKMKDPLDVSLCFNQRWQADLQVKGEALEISPARIDLHWHCTFMGTCSWSSNGAPLTDARFVLNRIPHSDEALLGVKKETARLHAAGIQGALAAQWKTSGFTTDEAIQWGSAISPAEAAKWKIAGYGVEDGPQWLAKAGSADTAIEWKKAGFTLDDFVMWRNLGCKQSGFYGQQTCSGASDAKRWKQAGFTPSDASDWITRGVKDPATAKIAAARNRRKDMSKACRDGLQGYQEGMQGLGSMSISLGRIPASTMRALCQIMGNCTAACSSKKCGGIVPQIFGGPQLVSTCESLNQSYREMLSPPKQ